MKLLGLIGSLRKDSLNRKLYENYKSISADKFEFEEAKISDFPHYNQDIQDKEMPSSVLAVAELIRSADALLFVTPEYNYSIPGFYKNAIDWLSRVSPLPFSQKPAAILGASSGKLGAARAQYELRKIGVALDIQFLNRPEVMLGNAAEAFDENSVLKDETTKKILASHAENFKSWIEKLKQ